MRGGAGLSASARVGVPPAVFRVPRNTLERRWRTERLGSSAGCRAGRAPRQAGRLPYPRHACPLSVRLFVQDGIIPSFENMRTLGTSRRGRKPTSALSRARLRSDPRLHTSPVICARWYQSPCPKAAPPSRNRPQCVITLQLLPHGCLVKEGFRILDADLVNPVEPLVPDAEVRQFD